MNGDTGLVPVKFITFAAHKNRSYAKRNLR